jgi:hypothetical protein
MVELQDIFAEYGAEYRANHLLSPDQTKAFSAIVNCRTATLGAHLDECDECGFTRISYNSCRNRHCPKCQTLSKEKWLDNQRQDLLNTQYFHVVFTLPDTLNTVVLHNQETIYNLFFKAISETLLELCSNVKYLGAKPGITAILHTWGQNLCFHPHIHCVVTGGGVSPLGKWNSSSKKFFLPVKVISRKFRGKFLAFLGDAKLHHFNSDLTIPDKWSAFLADLYKKEWVAYCKKPFGGASKVLDYLGRYTHRVAISNNRIQTALGGKVSFAWRDYRDKNAKKVMTLSSEEFIRRFLLHILPSGLRKIRHYGIFASRDKKLRISRLRLQTNTPLPPPKLSVDDFLLKILGPDFSLCPSCGCGHLSRAAPCSA